MVENSLIVLSQFIFSIKLRVTSFFRKGGSNQKESLKMEATEEDKGINYYYAY